MHFGAGHKLLVVCGFADSYVDCLQAGAAVVLPYGLTMRKNTFKLQIPCSFMLVHAIGSLRPVAKAGSPWKVGQI